MSRVHSDVTKHAATHLTVQAHANRCQETCVYSWRYRLVHGFFFFFVPICFGCKMWPIRIGRKICDIPFMTGLDVSLFCFTGYQQLKVKLEKLFVLFSLDFWIEEENCSPSTDPNKSKVHLWHRFRSFNPFWKKWRSSSSVTMNTKYALIYEFMTYTIQCSLPYTVV